MEKLWNDILSYLQLQFGTLDSGMLLQQLAYDEKAPLIFSSGLFMCMFAIFIVIYALLSKKSLPRTFSSAAISITV